MCLVLFCSLCVDVCVSACPCILNILFLPYMVCVYLLLQLLLSCHCVMTSHSYSEHVFVSCIFGAKVF